MKGVKEVKIGVIPLDNRPYNRQNLYDIAAMDKDVELLMPERQLLGQNKQPAQLEALQRFVLDVVEQVDDLVLSMDMLIYGGLFPARLHHTKPSVLKKRLQVLRTIKAIKPQLKIYASALILRTPQYNSSLEEPDYYGEYGHDIFTYGVYLDRQTRGLNEDTQLASLKSHIPEAYLNDFIKRRQTNLALIEAMLELVHDDIINVLVIPQDDAYPEGFTAMDQTQIKKMIQQLNIEQRVYLHPGTDESGCTLLARCYLEKKGTIAIQADYLTKQFEQVIPLVEDRPFKESLVSHVLAAGMTLVEQKGDVCLAISGCENEMIDATVYYQGTDRQANIVSTKTQLEWDQLLQLDKRPMKQWVSHLKQISQPLYVLDATFCNGGEWQLVDTLAKEGLLTQMSGYAGWNTTCNRLGCLLATIAFSYFGQQTDAIEQFKIQRLIHDLIYATTISIKLQQYDLKQIGASYQFTKAQEPTVQALIKQKTSRYYEETMNRWQYPISFGINQVDTPFLRMTGVGFQLKKGETK